mgnify:CR=1 FL=1
MKLDGARDQLRSMLALSPDDYAAYMRAQEEAARRQQMDVGYRAATPGYPEFAEQARGQAIPNSAEAASMSGIPILSEAGDAALTVDALRRGDYGEAALGALASAIPVLGLGTIKQVMRGADQLTPELPRNAPRFEAFETARRNAALPRSQGGLGLPPNNTAMDRARAMGYTVPTYHGTHDDIDAFDPAMSGIGTHVGTQEQAENRLMDVARQRVGLGAGPRLHHYEEGANVMPLLMSPGKVKDVKDVGMWNDSVSLLEHLPNTPVKEDLYDEAVELKESFEYLDEWPASRENQEILREVQPMIVGNADTLRYRNQVENAFGSDAGLTREAELQQRDLQRRKNEIQDLAYSRRPTLPDNPTDEQVQAWLAQPSNWEDYAAPDELAMWGKLNDQDVEIRTNPQYRNDPYSYVVPESSRLRSRFAAFDPLLRDSSDLLAGIAPWALGIPALGALYMGKPTGSEDNRL